MMFICCRSGTDEEYGERESLLQEALELYEESCTKAKKDKKDKTGVMVREAAMKTLKEKPTGKTPIYRVYILTSKLL